MPQQLQKEGWSSGPHHSALSSAKIKYNCGVDVSLATVKRVIESAKHLKRLKKTTA